MSVYVVTTDNRLVSFPAAPYGKSTWILDEGATYRIFYRNCDFRSCSDDSHRMLIAFVQKSGIVSIGFERPVAIEGRMLTFTERNSLREIMTWLRKRKTLPVKIKRCLPPYEGVVALVKA